MTASERRPPTDPESFRPSATLDMLRLRSQLLDATRAFFRERGFWEVETPILSQDVVVDAHLEPFVTRRDSGSPCAAAAARDELFLQTSPEFGMKRIVASGARAAAGAGARAGAIFQITRAFRRGEVGRYHNPEFTIVEWYQVGTTYYDQMSLVEEFVGAFYEAARNRPPSSTDGPTDSTAAEPAPLAQPFERLTYDEAFRRALGTPVISLDATDLAALAKTAGIEPPPSLAADDAEGWRNLLLALAVEPVLAQRGSLFLYDYPPDQAALARIRPGRPPVAERFELYLSGIEIANGYQELTDADELIRRIAAQSALRVRDGHRPLPPQSRLLDAMRAGLPDCAGVALGFDRLLMASVGASSLADVIAFPFDRA